MKFYVLNIAHGDLPSASELSGEEWFEELALYAEGVIHHSTLSARTFSEVLTLDQQDGLMGWHPGFPEGKEVKQVGDSD